MLKCHNPRLPQALYLEQAQGRQTQIKLKNERKHRPKRKQQRHAHLRTKGPTMEQERDRPGWCWFQQRPTSSVKNQFQLVGPHMSSLSHR